MRPVLMTAAAAGLEVLPIAVGWGAGAELQQPMAIALVGGLITSTILTLYEIGEGLHAWLTRTRADRLDEGLGATPAAGD